jgi:hypothetical protein
MVVVMMLAVMTTVKEVLSAAELQSQDFNCIRRNLLGEALLSDPEQAEVAVFGVVMQVLVLALELLPAGEVMIRPSPISWRVRRTSNCAINHWSRRLSRTGAAITSSTSSSISVTTHFAIMRRRGANPNPCIA